MTPSAETGSASAAKAHGCYADGEPPTIDEKGSLRRCQALQLFCPVRDDDDLRRGLVGGLLDHQESLAVGGYRVRLVLAQDRPTLTGYDQDRWAERLRYDQASVEMALEEFSVLRRSNLRLIAGAASTDLERVGVHAERGEESVSHMIRLYAGHDLLHLAQIARIRHAISPPGRNL